MTSNHSITYISTIFPSFPSPTQPASMLITLVQWHKICYTKFGARKLGHTFFHIFFSPDNIFDIFNPSQTSSHINSFSLIPLFYSFSHSILYHTSFPLTLPLLLPSLHFTLRLFLTVFVHPVQKFLSAISCPMFCTISL